MRYHILDNIRGLTFVSMFAFHTCWDLANMFGVSMPWFNSTLGYIWQQSILWMFILLSGFCWGLGHNQAKRGVIVFAAGALVSAVTMAVMPEDPVIFGVLTFMGTAMIVLCPFKERLESLPALPALAICIVLFLITRDIPFGYLGFEGLHIAALPAGLYSNLTTAFFGFQPAGFVSSDYVPLIPWIFLYLSGYFTFRAYPRRSATQISPQDQNCRQDNRKILALPQQRPWPLVSFIGCHSLEFYLLHQVAIYAVLSIGFAILNNNSI